MFGKDKEQKDRLGVGAPYIPAIEAIKSVTTNSGTMSSVEVGHVCLIDESESGYTKYVDGRRTERIEGKGGCHVKFYDVRETATGAIDAELAMAINSEKYQMIHIDNIENITEDILKNSVGKHAFYVPGCKDPVDVLITLKMMGSPVGVLINNISEEVRQVGANGIQIYTNAPNTLSELGGVEIIKL